MALQYDKVWIDGPAGKLETIYLAAQGAARGVAVVNHPNPLQGGTNTNKVVQTAAKALSMLGFHCYLPNLRGVGASEGEHDYGKGETEDCVAVADFARANHPEAGELIISGFSFGGYVAVSAAHRRHPDLLLLMGPAVNHYENREPASAPDAKKTLIIHGAEDEVIALQKALDWAGPQDIPVVVLPQTSHFFHGKLMPLRDTILRFAPAVLDEK
ncbi:MAG: alpha/beta hydrolase [Neisseria sp.]|uniref:alpha/beta hydrolase n=1 Tax=Neisseria sp. TaxID=192066 RepID=UPI0026DA803F|nr:alpha/beta fold hydrolase [Neisseria sp.]MDO4642181.1 alpha/beta hydrolase [Neisseria sp.]